MAYRMVNDPFGDLVFTNPLKPCDLLIEKNKLVDTIKKACIRTTNSAKQITLANYYCTLIDLDEESIDFKWYYNRLKEMGL